MVGIPAIVGALFGGAGAAALSATVIFTAVAEVGLIATAVGAVTGNEKLMKIGGVLGLVGGAGALVTSAVGSAGSAAASQAAGSTAQQAGQQGAQVAQQAGVQGAQQAATQGVSQSVTQGIAQTAPLGQSSIIGGAQQAAQSVAPGLSAPVTEGISSVGQAAKAVSGMSTPYAGLATPVNQGLLGAGSATGATTALSAGGDSGGYFSNLGGWAQKNPQLAGTMLQIGGNMVQGAAQSRAADKRDKKNVPSSPGRAIVQSPTGVAV